jgi:hypothetical protein
MRECNGALSESKIKVIYPIRHQVQKLQHFWPIIVKDEEHRKESTNFGRSQWPEFRIYLLNDEAV